LPRVLGRGFRPEGGQIELVEAEQRNALGFSDRRHLMGELVPDWKELALAQQR
jgi:hypothetical protein